MGPAAELVIDDRYNEINPAIPAEADHPLDKVGLLGRWHKHELVTQVSPGAIGIHIAHDDTDSGIMGRPEPLEGRHRGRRAGTSDENTQFHDE